MVALLIGVGVRLNASDLVPVTGELPPPAITPCPDLASRPGVRQAPRAGAVKDAHRAPRSGARRASLTAPSTVLNSRQEGRSASCCVLRRAPGYHPHAPYQFLPDAEKTRLLFRRLDALRIDDDGTRTGRAPGLLTKD